MAAFRRLAGAVPALLSLAAMILFLVFPLRYTESVREGISLWAATVLPATFPFLVLSAVFTRSGLFFKFSALLSKPAGKLFRVSGASASAAVLAAVSGYPVGARVLADLRRCGAVSEDELFRAACLSTTSGPMFLVGAVGARMFSSSAAGWILFVSHLLGIWTVCLFLGIGKRAPASPPRPLSARGDDLIAEAVLAVLCVGGSVALFFAFGQMLADLDFLGLSRYPVLAGLVRGLLEMTCGCKQLASVLSPVRLAAACFLVTFGGACVLVQQLAFLKGAGVKPLPFLAVKAAQGLLAGGYCYLLALLL